MGEDRLLEEVEKMDEAKEFDKVKEIDKAKETGGAKGKKAFAGEKKSRLASGLLAVVCSLVFALLLSMAAISACEDAFYQKLAGVVGAIPESQGLVMKALKEPGQGQQAAGEKILEAYGYAGGILTDRQRGALAAKGLLWALPPIAFFAALYGLSSRRVRHRAGDLTSYLEKINQGHYSMRMSSEVDELSQLEDAVYKNVVMLRESREREQAGRENLARSLADISHQLKTPVTAISLLQELMEGYVRGEEEKKLLTRMEEQTQRLYSLTAALLTLSRADAGVLTLKVKRTDIAELVSCAASPVRPLMAARRQQLVTEGAGNLFLVCDIGWTAEALGNILKNCSEHTPSGGKILLQIQQNPVYTRIVIEDEGPGFTGDECRRIFERFYRGSQASGESAGIGLALAKMLIEQQNGDIRAQNRPEGGARFVITFYPQTVRTG